MKKISIFFIMAVLVSVGISSCGASSDSNEKNVALKIDNNEELTPDDYSCIIDYVGRYAEKAQKYVDMQINGENPAEATEGMDQLKEEFPLVDKFRDALKAAPLDKLSPENLKELAKYAGYIEFSVPAGYTIETNPDAAGMEVAVPDSANGVVAGAVDTIAVKD